MSVRVGRLALTVGAVATACIALVPSARVAASSGWEVIATGLDNPRGIEFAPDGSLYVVEAGKGGEAPCATSPEGGAACYGPTGAITRLARTKKGWSQARVVTGLPSLAPPPSSPDAGGNAIGPHNIAFDDRGGWVTIGLGANPEARAIFGEIGKRFGRLLRLRHKARPRLGADLAEYELDENPDGTEPDSNPYGIDALDRRRVVTDAGGNTLLQVAHTKISTLAVFPIRMVQNPFAPPGTLMPMQAVPTSVVQGPDGALYVGQLTGFPFPQGGANVYRVPAGGGTPTIYAAGFTNVIDIGFGPDKKLYVLELATNGLLSGDPTGRLVRVGKNGEQTTIASNGLVMPGGFTIAKDGTIYVTNLSVAPGGGQVVKIRK